MTRTTELLRSDEGLVEVPGDPAVEERIAVREFQGSDAMELLGCAFGAFCLTWLVYERLTPLSGGLGFFVSWYALFLAAVWF
ncbi:MAG: hypothetical protein QOE62_3871, partial [Actinomycetota bacterium]|nr:hypothetical protein [Actinomycetota bacterium]